MTQVDVSCDTPGGLAGLIGDFRKQMSFALSVAINDTLNQVQTATQVSLPRDFTLRRADFIRNTIYIGPQDRATKANLVGVVRVDPDPKRDFLVKYEDDAVKTESAGVALAIPIPRIGTPGLIINRGSPLGVKVVMSLIKQQGGHVVGPFKRRSMKRAQQQSFFLLKGKNGHTLVMQRLGPSAVRVLYEFVTSVPIASHRLHFEEIADKTVDARWTANFERAIDFAIATAR